MPKTIFQPGNAAAVKHNGETAVKSITAGTELTGPARQAELQVYSELATEGRTSIITRNAARLQAAADLFWAAVVTAGENNDLAALDRYIARFGWLSGASLRAWEAVGREEKNSDDSGIIEAIQSARGQNGDNSRSD